MGYESTSGLNTLNHYGPRDVGRTVGAFKTVGAEKELSLMITPADVTGDTLHTLKLPAGAKVSDVYVKVSEAFDLGGTTPTILVGTNGSEVTNGVVISETQAEAVGFYALGQPFAGTWANMLAADTQIGIALGGAVPTIDDSQGKLEVIIKYQSVVV